MQKSLRLLDTPGGHILVALFLVVLGLVAIKLQVNRAEEILIGALAALWPLLRNAGNPPSSPSKDENATDLDKYRKDG